MRALTPDVWAEHHGDLAELVLARWPTLTEAQLREADGDFEALVAAVADAEGLSRDAARRELAAVEVDERAFGTSDPGRTLEETPGQASLARLRLGHGFGDGDRGVVLDILDKLERRLSGFPADATELELSVKDRGEQDQKVTLEAWLPRLGHIAAVSHEADLRAALAEVRDDLWRQIDDTLGKRRPYT